jgi:uncharacterized protein YegL
MSTGVYKESLVELFLAYHNRDVESKLRQQAEETKMGQRLNELCDYYHLANHISGQVGTVTKWPRPGAELSRNDDSLSDFLFSRENSTPKIEAFKSCLRPPLVYTSKYPKNEKGFPVPPPQVSPPKQVSFLLDYSGSMAGSRINNAVDNIIHVFKTYINAEDSVSFSRFDHKLDLQFPMALKDEKRMHDKILACREEANGGTAFYDAVITTLSTFTSGVQSAAGATSDWLITLTDGGDCHSSNSLDHCITAVRRSNVNLFIIGLEVKTVTGLNLERIANEGASPNKLTKYVYAGDQKSLEQAFCDAGELLDGPVLLT